jgi:hypothetical protein
MRSVQSALLPLLLTDTTSIAPESNADEMTGITVPSQFHEFKRECNSRAESRSRHAFDKARGAPVDACAPLFENGAHAFKLRRSSKA